MKKMQLEICCGTTCYMMGANRLLYIENEVSPELRGKFEVKASQCMGLCNDKNLSGAPYVKLNGIVIENATVEKICEKMRTLLEE